MKNNEGRAEILVQLADEAVAAPCLTAGWCACVLSLSYRSSAIEWQYAAVTMSGFDGRAVKNKQS